MFSPTPSLFTFLPFFCSFRANDICVFIWIPVLVNLIALRSFFWRVPSVVSSLMLWLFPILAQLPFFSTQLMSSLCRYPNSSFSNYAMGDLYLEAKYITLKVLFLHSIKKNRFLRRAYRFWSYRWLKLWAIAQSLEKCKT